MTRYKYTQIFLSVVYSLLLDDTAGSVYKLFMCRQLIYRESKVARFRALEGVK